MSMPLDYYNPPWLDVDTDPVADGDTLVYDSVTGEWVATAPTGGSPDPDIGKWFMVFGPDNGPSMTTEVFAPIHWNDGYLPGNLTSVTVDPEDDTRRRGEAEASRLPMS